MKIVVIAHNIRSTHNVGAILRSCDGFGVSKLYCTGYTPYPEMPNDLRLPHLRAKITNQIHKTALGAEKTIPVAQSDSILPVIAALKKEGYSIVALEQVPDSILLQHFAPTGDIALLLGEEVNGIPPEIIATCDTTIEIPMYGQKESFNVSVAAGIALYGICVSRR